MHDNILAAERRIRSHVSWTPLLPAPWLSADGQVNVLLKHENQQCIGAFKIRGAANKLLLLSKEEAARGIVTASNGNHALAVATIGRELGMAVEVFVSDHISPDRKERIEGCGATVRVVEGEQLLSEETARADTERTGRVFISPYNDIDVVAGQGTTGFEILRDVETQGNWPLDAIYVAVGGGGLVGGIGAYVKSISPQTKIVGCWPEKSPVMYESIRSGKIVDLPDLPTLSASTAGNIEAGSVTFPICQQVIDDFVLVSEEEIFAALRLTYAQSGIVLEGAAGVAIAAFLKDRQNRGGKNVAIVLCGGNADPDLREKITAA